MAPVPLLSSAGGRAAARPPCLAPDLPSTSGRPSVAARATAPAQTSLKGTAKGGSSASSAGKGGRTVRQQQQGGGSVSVSGSSGGPDNPDRPKGSQFYFNVTGFPFPLGPVFKRSTLRREVGGGR